MSHVTVKRIRDELSLEQSNGTTARLDTSAIGRKAPTKRSPGWPDRCGCAIQTLYDINPTGLRDTRNRE